MSTAVGFPTLTIQGWAPPDKSGYMEQISKRAPALIAPADKVLYAGLEHRPVVGYQFDWLTDDLLPLAVPAGQAFETEPAYQTTLLRNRLSNVIQMFRGVWSISEYSEIIAKNGGISSSIVSEVSRQIMLIMKQLSRNIERTIASLVPVGLENAPGTAASSMGGYFSQITTQNATLGKTNTITNFTATPTQTLANFLDETTFQNQILSQYTNGAGQLSFVTTPAVKFMIGRTFNGRANARETSERGSHNVDTMVDQYFAPEGGLITIQSDRSIGDCGLLYDEEQCQIGDADAMRVFRSDPGSFQNMYGRVRTYITLLTGNPQASGGWTTTNTPAAAGS